jgi:hypothetical protein
VKKACRKVKKLSVLPITIMIDIVVRSRRGQGVEVVLYNLL